MKTIIGVVGVKTSGKSTVSQMIKEFLPKNQVIEVALADKLKNVCAEVFNIPRSTFDDQRYKEIPFSAFNIDKRLKIDFIRTICDKFDKFHEFHKHDFSNIVGMKLESARHIAQIVGTQILRALGDEDIHCKHLKLSSNITIVSDIRFENEFNYFNNLKGYRFIPIYVKRYEAEKHIDLKTSHVSETSVFKFKDKCIELDNDSSLRDLEANVQKIVNSNL